MSSLPGAMSVSAPILNVDEHAARWQEWQLNNARGNRAEARRSRVVAVVVMAVLGIWLLIQLLSVPAVG